MASSGIQGVLFYSVAYAFMNLGAFAVVAALQRRPGVTSQLTTFTGLGYRAAVPALLMTIFLLSLTGIPPLAGFFAKAIVVLSALEVGGGMTLLAVIMMLNAAMAAFYYLRVVVYMYMRQPADDAAGGEHRWLHQAGPAAGRGGDHPHRPLPAGDQRHPRLDRGGRHGPGTALVGQASVSTRRRRPATRCLASRRSSRATSSGPASTRSARGATARVTSA